MSIAELQIACFMLSLLMAATFWIYANCAAAYSKSDVHLDLMTGLHHVSERLTTEVQKGTYSGVEVSPALGVSFLSALDHNTLQYDTQTYDPGLLRWDKYAFFRYNSAQKTVEYWELELSSGASQQHTPTVVDQYNGPSGLKPLTYYLQSYPGASWSVLAENVSSCAFSYDPAFKLMGINLTLQKTRLRKNQPDTVSGNVTASFRN